MKDLKSFCYEYRVFLGNYVQQNKYEVKQKLLDFINRI